jgi:hypothetical protein
MSAKFELADGGIGVMPDPADNPQRHAVPHHDAGTRISFDLLNVGDVGGTAQVTVECDGEVIASVWTSGQLAPGCPDTGLVSLGRLDEGPHRVTVHIDPGAGSRELQTNEFRVA